MVNQKSDGRMSGPMSMVTRVSVCVGRDFRRSPLGPPRELSPGDIFPLASRHHGGRLHNWKRGGKK